MHDKTEANLMIEELLKHCETIEIGAIRNVGRVNESFIKHNWPGTGKLLAWAAFENAKNDANILIRPSPCSNHSWLFLDDLPLEIATKLSKKYQCIIVETSKGNFQARLLADCSLSVHQRADVQRIIVKKLRLVDPLNADDGSTAGDKFGRLPSFRNKKIGKDFLTNLYALPNLSLPKFDPLPLLISPPQVGVCVSAVKKNKQTGKTSGDQSCSEFGYVVNRLRHFKAVGLDYIKESSNLEYELIKSSSSRRSNPQYYAKLTIKKALDSM